MMHLFDSDERLGLDLRDFTANCGERLTMRRVMLRNNWAIGQCQPWLDRPTICDACRQIAMKALDKRYTYGISEAQ